MIASDAMAVLWRGWHLASYFGPCWKLLPLGQVSTHTMRNRFMFMLGENDRRGCLNVIFLTCSPL